MTKLKYITVLLSIFLTSEASLGAVKCENLFKNQAEITSEAKNTKTKITDLNSFGQAVTEGMLLNENQPDLFEIYRKLFLGDPNTSVDNKTLKSVLDILKKHPELVKKHFQEFEISTVEKVYETPERLAKFIKSQTTTAGQVRNNLFQIEANLDFWRKILNYKDAEIPEQLKPLNLGKNATEQDKAKAREVNNARAEWQVQAQLRFVKYLNRIISKTNRELLADLKNENLAYYQKSKALFETLKYLESWMSKNNRNTQAIRQAMLDLVFTVGYGNQATLELLKSPNGLDKIQGLNQLWNEADSFAEDLKYSGHIAELKQKLNIEFTTGFTKNDDFIQIVKSLEQEVLQSNFTTKPSNTMRVRSLTIQESPFRSCLGKDCSTRTYFDKALDPNYIYFTMTDTNHHSDGHVTLVLGTATNPETGALEKVAFLDKLQNIPTQQIELFLNAVDQSLQTQGYHLAIPTYLGKDIPGHGGISNMEVITDFVQMNIMPRLDHVLKEFTPHQHDYQFHNAYSRGDKKLEVRIFKVKALDQNTEIKRGQQTQAYQAGATLDKNQLIQEVLKLKESDKPEDIMKFMTSAAGIIELGLYKKEQLMQDLLRIQNDEKYDAKIRKQAVYNSVGLEKDIQPLIDHANKLSDSELSMFVNEVLSFENSSNKNLKFIYSQFNLFNPRLGVRIFSKLLKNPKTDVNVKDAWGNTALFNAILDANKEIIQLLLSDSRLDVNIKNNRGENVLIFGISHVRDIKIFQMLLNHPNIDVNFQDSNDGESLLFKAVKNGKKNTVQLLLKHPNIDVNAKSKFGGYTALIEAVNDGRNNNEILQMLLNHPNVDVNVKNMNSATALLYAVTSGYKNATEMLLKHPNIDVNAKSLNDGSTALIRAARNGSKDIVKALLEFSNVDVNIKDNFDRTALMNAAQSGHKEIADLITQHIKDKEAKK